MAILGEAEVTGRAEPRWLADGITPTFLLRTLRDEIFEKLGVYLGRPRNGESHFIDCKAFGLHADINGGTAYVMWGKDHHWRPDAYLKSPGKVLWVRIDHLQRFADTVLPRLDYRFVLVSTDADYSPLLYAPDAVEKILASDKVAHWFCAQSDVPAGVANHTFLPLGIPYPYRYDLPAPLFPLSKLLPRTYDIAGFDADLQRLIATAMPLRTRKLAAFGDFGLNNSSKASPWGETRADIRAVLEPTGTVVFPAALMSQQSLYRAYGTHAFVASPFGRGLDCYRTWEALLMGAVPIVKTSALDPVFAGFPVAIVQDWGEVNKTRLEDWANAFADLAGSPELYARLAYAPWRDKIARAAAALG